MQPWLAKMLRSRTSFPATTPGSIELHSSCQQQLLLRNFMPPDKNHMQTTGAHVKRLQAVVNCGPVNPA
jgi:hypothetical protein